MTTKGGTYRRRLSQSRRRVLLLRLGIRLFFSVLGARGTHNFFSIGLTKKHFTNYKMKLFIDYIF